MTGALSAMAPSDWPARLPVIARCHGDRGRRGGAAVSAEPQ